MSNEIEYYIMPSFPTLAALDLIASTRWYQEVLGFQLVFEMPGSDGNPILTHLRWAKYADLLLVADRNHTSEQKGIGVSLSFAMTHDSVDNLAARIVSKGCTVANGPIDQPWNVREITVIDPDGYRLVFTQQINRQMSMDDVMNSIKKVY